MSAFGDAPKTAPTSPSSSSWSSVWPWRILTIVFGLATLVSLGVAVWSLLRNEQVVRRNDELQQRDATIRQKLLASTAELQRVAKEYSTIRRDLLDEINANERLARANRGLNEQILRALRRNARHGAEVATDAATTDIQASHDVNGDASDVSVPVSAPQ